MLFSKFITNLQRDAAVNALSRSKREGKYIRAKPDRPADIRAPHNFLMGVRWFLINKCPANGKLGFHKSIIKVDDAKLTLKVGGKLALTAWTENNQLKHKWEEEWATWTELQNCTELQEIHERSQKALEQSGVQSKGSSKGHRD